MILSFVGITSAICFYTDIRYRKILNQVTLPSIAFGAIYWSAHKGAEGLLFWAIGLLFGFLVLFIPFMLGGMGEGDVKMMAMIGALAGPFFLLKTFLWSSLIGGIMALGYLLVFKGHRKDFLPYGVPITLGVFTQIMTQVWLR